MRLAILADIRGNLLALEAVAEDLGRRRVDAVVNLGDCVSGPLWPRETVALLMREGWPALRGNDDHAVLEIEGGRLGLELIAIPYDHFTAARRAEANSRPDWAHALATGYAAAPG